MGIVTITGNSNKDNGEYDVEVQKDTTLLLRKKLKLDGELNFLTGLPKLVRSLSSTLGIIEFNILVKAAEIDTAILLEEDTKELTEQLIELTIERNFVRSRRDETNLIIKAKEQTLTIYNARLDETDFRTLWATDLKTDLNIGDTVISVELEQNKDRILIAPHIYKVKQSDIDHKDVIKGNAQTKLNDLNTAVTNANARMDSDQLHIDALFVDLDAARGNPIEFNRIKNEIDITVASKAKFLTERQSQQEAADKANNELLEIESEYNALVAAFQSADGLFIPGINEFTKQLQPILSSNRMSAAYNVISLPAVQKWEPTYRSGIISNIDTGDNVCTVDLDVAGSKPPTVSTKRTLDINQQSTYTLVPVRYGSCDAAAFEDGDEVMVNFRDKDYTDPEVIGFMNNPKPCSSEFVYFMHHNGNTYEYTKEGDSARFIANNSDKGLGIAGKHLAEDYYAVGGGTDGKLYKNGVAITSDLRSGPFEEMTDCWSDGVFVYCEEQIVSTGSDWHIYKRNLDGTAVLDYDLIVQFDIKYVTRGQKERFIKGRSGTFVLPGGSPQEPTIYNNDDGAIIQKIDINNFFNFIDIVTASDGGLFGNLVDDDPSSMDTWVHNVDGTRIGTLVVARSVIDSINGDTTAERPAAIALTDTHYFLLTQSTGTSRVLIYDITVEKTLGVPSNVTLGTLQHAVNTPITNDFVQNKSLYRSHSGPLGG